jgi:hypothetical protein
LNRNESGRFGALNSDSTHHFFRNACTKSGSLRFFTVFRLLTDFVCLYNYEFLLSLCKIVWSSVILLLPLFTITMPNVTAGGIFSPEVMNNEIKDNIPARTSPGLTRSLLATTRNRVANDICVPRKILRDTPDLSYVQPDGNYYFKTSDSYQILKSCSISISDCLKSPGTCDSSPCITTCKIKTDKHNTCKTCGMLITSPEFTWKNLLHQIV